MDDNFKKIELADKEIIRPYLLALDSKCSETTFANLYLWSRQYPMKYTIVEDMVISKSMTEQVFAFPFGKGDLKKAVDHITAYQDACGEEVAFQCVTPEQYAQLEQLYPGRFLAEYDRDYADYVYLVEDLASLRGKKFHGKKNHVNKFQKTYLDWSYEPIDEHNLEECFQMGLRWRNENGCNEDEEKNQEMCVSLNALRLFRELDLIGGALRVNGEIVAFTLGEAANQDTFVVHIEKARSDIEGAYTMINQQFVQKELLGKYMYVNREDDAGEEGLRKAKLSYRPLMLVEKGYITERKQNR